MWLLNTQTYALHGFNHEDDIPPYAILSHTWGENEVLFADILDVNRAQSKSCWSKIQRTCEEACHDGLQWAWIDSCCIDKTSSAELSEAINSMFDWYQGSRICYVLLSDLSPGCPALCDEIEQDEPEWFLNFARCSWFRRGWCLQELLGPTHIRFFNSGWKTIGDLHDLLATVSHITRIEVDVLMHLRPVSEVRVAVRMSWAAHRRTTRPEDIAYALLGIFDINMPLLYGEGRRAFVRLQEEIIRTSTDLSIFAWQVLLDQKNAHIANRALLAPSPDAYSHCSTLTTIITPQIGASARSISFAMTNAGLRLTAPIIKMPGREDEKGLLLNYIPNGERGKMSVLPLCEDKSDGRYHVAIDPSFGYSSRGRLAQVGIQSLSTAQLETLTIARDPLLNRQVKPSKITFVLRIAHGCPITVIESHPRREWNVITNTWAPNRFDGDTSTAIVLCRHKYGEHFTIAIRATHGAPRNKRIAAGFLNARTVQEAWREASTMNREFRTDRQIEPHHLQISVPFVAGLRGPRLILMSLLGGPYAAHGIDGAVTFHQGPAVVDLRMLTNRYALK